MSHTGGSAEGWYKDPTRHHAERWFSDGTPTALVRDGDTTAQDPLSEAEIQAAASAELEFVGLPVADPTQADGVQPSPPGQAAWWDVGVPNKDEPGVDLGLDGAVGYEISLAVRLGNRMWRRKRRNSSEK